MPVPSSVLRFSFIIIFLSVTGQAISQISSAPSRKEARNSIERAAYDKALCIYRAITKATEVLSPETGRTELTPELRERAKIELEQFMIAERQGVQRCLTESEVHNLGRFSFLEDMAFAIGSTCRLTKAPAAKFGRTPNNSDGDIVNGATKWADPSTLDNHPFFRAQNAARQEFRNRPQHEICEAIEAEFGPNGSRFGGLVRIR